MQVLRSNPKSKNYGKHLSAEEVVEFFAPAEASFNAIKYWLVEAGISSDAISQSSNKQVSDLPLTATRMFLIKILNSGYNSMLPLVKWKTS